jgi:hypothetical protein
MPTRPHLESLPLQALPRRELLDALARHYHHLQNEHKRAAPESGMRRRIEKRMLDVRERFDRALSEWVLEPELQQAWGEYLHYRASEPAGPPAIRPLLFRGISDAGSVAEIRGKQGEELEVVIDGSLVERVAALKDLARVDVPARFRLEPHEFVETFSASADALKALEDFLAQEGSPPPWEHAEELLADGLIETHFAVTPRGRRALASRKG